MEQTLAATQFEATAARRAFPCFDEPVFKAIWFVTLTVPTGYTTLSNARVSYGIVAASGLLLMLDTTRMIPLCSADSGRCECCARWLQQNTTQCHHRHIRAASFHASGHDAQKLFEEDAGVGMTRHRFQATPPMSSYLVAFVVGNLTQTSTAITSGLDPVFRYDVSVWGTPDR